jgi:hypothetical protein
MEAVTCFAIDARSSFLVMRGWREGLAGLCLTFLDPARAGMTALSWRFHRSYFV